MAAAAFRKQNPALLIQTVCRCVRFHDAQPTVISIGIFRRVIIIGIGLLGVCTVRKQDDLSARIIDGVQGKFQVKVQVFGYDILGQRSSTVPLLQQTLQLIPFPRILKAVFGHSRNRQAVVMDPVIQRVPIIRPIRSDGIGQPFQILLLSILHAHQAVQLIILFRPGCRRPGVQHDDRYIILRRQLNEALHRRAIHRLDQQNGTAPFQQPLGIVQLYLGTAQAVVRVHLGHTLQFCLQRRTEIILSFLAHPVKKQLHLPLRLFDGVGFGRHFLYVRLQRILPGKVPAQQAEDAQSDEKIDQNMPHSFS